MILIISACSSSKNDTNPISEKSVRISPQDYLGDVELVSQFLVTRKQIFEEPRASIGHSITHAFDLYVHTGFAYRHLRRGNLDELKSRLETNDTVKWFFLSGGYGMINSLEPAVKYQATFNRNISYQNNIPFTGTIWKPLLPRILDEIISILSPDMTYIFGSRDYTWFVKQTRAWEKKDMIMLESTGSAGPHWLSPRINALVNHILQDDVYEFDAQYNKFNKQ